MKLFILLLVGVSSFANAENLSVQQLNRILTENHANWVAKENWLTHLSHEELVRMMGAQGVEPKSVDFRSFDVKPNSVDVHDWRNVGGVNYVSPILNQGNCGSCVAFAAVGTLETQKNITSGIPQLNNKFSAEALFACGGGACERGWMPPMAAQYLIKTGVPDEACAPYTMGATGQDVSCSSICSDSSARATNIVDFTSPAGMADVKAALKKGPMMTTLTVYADFVSYSSGVYKHTTGAELGGHAVSLIGYDDTKNAWIIRNSWGEDWGMKGFAYVDYNDISGIADSNQLLELAPKGSYLVTDFVDRSYISGTYTFKSKMQPAVKIGGVTIQIIDDKGTVVASRTCMTPGCFVDFDSTQVPDGKYEFKSVSNGSQLHRYFYVSNKAASATAASISMKPKAFNPATPVKDRIEFDLNLNTGTGVPFQKIAFVFKDSTGKVTERWSDNIADVMSTGWRTPTVPNGKYDVWMKGTLYSSGSQIIIESPKISLTVKN